MPTHSASATVSMPSYGPFCRFDHERGEFRPTDDRRLQFFENLVGSRASESPLVPLLRLVRRHSTTDDGLFIRRQVHDRNLTVLPAADPALDEIAVSQSLGEACLVFHE